MKNFLNKLPELITFHKLVILCIALIAIILFALRAAFFNKPKAPQEYQPTFIEYKNPGTETAETSAWKTYENGTCAYQIRYPAAWHIFTDEAEAGFANLELDDGQTVKQGASVFWSNKDTIDYTEETKPDDFRLLGLIIYEKPDTTLDDFAKLLGFTEEVETQSMAFKAENIMGKEYVSVGATQGQPRAAIIFKDNDRFHVFHLGFIGNDKEALKTMEEIVGTFRAGE